MNKGPSAYLQAIAQDNSLPIEQQALDLWLQDLQNPLRWGVRPLLQFVFAVLLHIIWFFKRLPLPQFRAHRLLQRLICWFCTYFVRREANLLIQTRVLQQDNLDYIDVHTAMLDNDGRPRPELFVRDQLHLSAEGYGLWRQIVSAHLRP